MNYFQRLLLFYFRAIPHIGIVGLAFILPTSLLFNKDFRNNVEDFVLVNGNYKQIVAFVIFITPALTGATTLVWQNPKINKIAKDLDL